MKNRVFILISLFASTLFSANIVGAELTQNYLDGMKLAFVIIPATPVEKKEDTTISKPKPATF